jgi:hypothetical protein
MTLYLFLFTLSEYRPLFFQVLRPIDVFYLSCLSLPLCFLLVHREGLSTDGG